VHRNANTRATALHACGAAASDSGTTLGLLSRSKLRACAFISAISVVALSLTTATAAASGPRWVIQPTPHGTPAGVLTAVSCSSANACMAVGWYLMGQNNVPLAESWNGTGWSIQPTPVPHPAINGELYGITCPAVNLCVAVGQYGTQTGGGPLVEGWNGRSWTLQAAPNPTGAQGSVLDAVSCISTTSCMALGRVYYAVAQAQPPFAESWNGVTWSVVAVPSPYSDSASLGGISCFSAESCLAVGTWGGGTPLSEIWNGTKWAMVPMPAPVGSFNVSIGRLSCTSPTGCTTVGFYYDAAWVLRTLAERWNGSSWTIQTTPNPSALYGDGLESVVCQSATACTAVGFTNINSSGLEVSSAETWNGIIWSVVSTPNPSGATGGAILLDLACTSVATCTAVGDYYRGTLGRPLVERSS
jgi:hypothetical protein